MSSRRTSVPKLTNSFETKSNSKAALSKYRYLTQKEISGLKKLLNQMETKYRDPESKNKIKQLKGDAQKQIERNRIILKDIITEYPFVEPVPSRGGPSGRRTRTTTRNCWREELSITITSTGTTRVHRPRRSQYSQTHPKTSSRS